MTYALNETHDPSLKSFVESANDSITDFPIQNLPFCVFSRADREEAFRGGVAIGDQILDLYALAKLGGFPIFERVAIEAAAEPSLNFFMSFEHERWSNLRAELSRLLAKGSAREAEVANCLMPQALAQYALPAQIGDYTDFYASVHHATNVGKLFRPDNPLLPNYKWVPIGYHGRGSSIAVSYQRFARPIGQVCGAGQTVPVLQPSKRLDYELEMGIFVGKANALGEAVPIEAAEQHIFGMCLLNDWSARDIQGWEYQPLGPFLAKNFATTISPWIVTMEALAPFRQPFTRPAEDPQPLPYLTSIENTKAGALDINLEVFIETAKMRSVSEAPHRLSRGNMKDAAYWTIAQLVTHHTVNGCNLQPGDLLGTGTMSGPAEGSQGALLEITEGGKKPITLPNGEKRTFLEDGDVITLRGSCEREGAVKIGFGECRGEVLPARGSTSSPRA